jgi:hypothetical protein
MSDKRMKNKKEEQKTQNSSAEKKICCLFVNVTTRARPTMSIGYTGSIHTQQYHGHD